ncbi:Guanine nucleotide-binding protein subunit gamma-1 [Amphibalanus amphitrite]|uniref:Guanine nucleotide-binding protein subunit gamma-1 n=1 Tax=Amphibalanus amphitrite TaxID=1232801 RepID=A0A6A4W0M2_AMPAM|nr:guanine nucleotide-binding protein subunit gamma-1-like [Amphibalanus amphitrite]XP_043217657.1 guanine nucleotide-binding protein subunit gamma-1-like [Amphibalanus amphitrite]XP_043233263.1 guanine nucleotide-binding protein subunit gamma-1-like [Amphibalanus amphitrite]XP_043233264.1 guanine nucleotide-binding protein subunit gamma-1-like [Amphibalanus amphitrite]KAF0298759.1 Guanine nucleotide-binding protein subunit gamma-1 [Amphibalanus amphitrite]
MAVVLPSMQMSNVQQQRILVDQLRREANIRRINVSIAVEDIKKYITDHEQDDYLLVGFSSQKANPFREKSSCSVL